MAGRINQKTTLAEILKLPKAKEILVKYSFPCLECPLANFELENLKIGEVCKIYGIDSEKLLRELNKELNLKKEN